MAETLHGLDETALVACSGVHRVILLRKDACNFVVVKSKDFMGPHADGKHRPADYWWNKCFESRPVQRQFGFQDGVIMIDHRLSAGRYRAHGTIGLLLGHLSDWNKSFADSVDPQRSIRVQDNILSPLILHKI